MVEFRREEWGTATRPYLVASQGCYAGAVGTIVAELQPGRPVFGQVNTRFTDEHPAESVVLATWGATHRLALRRFQERTIQKAQAVRAGEPHTCPTCARPHRPE